MVLAKGPTVLSSVKEYLLTKGTPVITVGCSQISEIEIWKSEKIIVKSVTPSLLATLLSSSSKISKSIVIVLLFSTL